MPNTRVFHRDQLDALGLPHDLATEDNAREFPEAAVELHREQVDTRRWVSVHELIFRAPDDGKAYRVTYEQGLTEHQDDHDEWNYDREVTATEVEQYDQTVKAWRPVEEHPADREQPKPHPPEESRRILTEPEFEAAYRAAVRTARPGARIGSAILSDALAAALATVGILTPAPEPDTDTCPAMFADPEGGWWQCQQDPGHDPADGHDCGDWAWPDTEQAAEAQQ
jgi:hypothetical protein